MASFSSGGSDVAVNDQTVTIQVPRSADHVSLLRALIAMYAAREQFTLEEVDDLRMAVEEAAVQLLRRSSGASIAMTLWTTGHEVHAELSSASSDTDPIVETSSFSWTILSALSDGLNVETTQGQARVQISKTRATQLAGSA